MAFLPNRNTSLHGWVAYEPLSGHYLRLSIIHPDNDALKDQGINPLTKLLVLDSAYQKIAEVKLPFQTSGFQTADGFFLKAGYLTHEDEVAYLKLDFSKIRSLPLQ